MTTKQLMLMKFPSVKVFQCPQCGRLYQYKPQVVIEGLPVKSYADGKMEDPSGRQNPRITRCNDCGFIFWLRSEYLTGSMEFDKIGVVGAGQMLADYVAPLETECYLEALTDGNFRDHHEELYLRKYLWWSFNDRVRQGLPLFNGPDEKQVWKDNLERLLELLFETDVDEPQILSEIKRWLEKRRL